MNQYNELKKLFRDYYFRNCDGVVTGREYFNLIFQIKSDQLLSDLEVCNDLEMARHTLRSSVTLGLSYNEFLVAVSRYRSKATA